MEEHIIYKITNTVNEKIYIGKTKKFYGKTPFGIKNRLKCHIQSAFSDKRQNDCPKLYNAMRKYGKENFIIEELEVTTPDKVDSREEYYINSYNSTSDNIGYNIALGGLGRKVVFVNDKTREKISKAQKQNGEMNISEYKNKDGEIIGYKISRKMNGIDYSKYFTSQKFIKEENYESAKKYLELIKSGQTENSEIYKKYNKKNDLPKNINYVYSKSDKEKIVGYTVHIMKKSKMITKSFQSKDMPLEQLLKNAIEFKTQIESSE